MTRFDELPQECISHILSHTTPVDAVRLSVVSKTFLSAAVSNEIWNHFLPSDMDSIISQYSPSLEMAPTKKAIYLALSDRPIMIDHNRKSFQLERNSGKKCVMLAARDLTIVSDDDERCWSWTVMPDSRFPEVVALSRVFWLEIRGMINTMALSPNTQYESYLVYKLIDAEGFHNRPVESSIDNGGHSITNTVYLDPNVRVTRSMKGARVQRPTMRRDGWMEIEIGELFNSGLKDKKVCISVMETNGGNVKSGLFVEGIEIRPK